MGGKRSQRSGPQYLSIFLVEQEGGEPNIEISFSRRPQRRLSKEDVERSRRLFAMSLEKLTENDTDGKIMKMLTVLQEIDRATRTSRFDDPLMEGAHQYGEHCLRIGMALALQHPDLVRKLAHPLPPRKERRRSTTKK